jgi:hypothetical protein
LGFRRFYQPLEVLEEWVHQYQSFSSFQPKSTDNLTKFLKFWIRDFITDFQVGALRSKLIEILPLLESDLQQEVKISLVKVLEITIKLFLI